MLTKVSGIESLTRNWSYWKFVNRNCYLGNLFVFKANQKSILWTLNMGRLNCQKFVSMTLWFVDRYFFSFHWDTSWGMWQGTPLENIFAKMVMMWQTWFPYQLKKVVGNRAILRQRERLWIRRYDAVSSDGANSRD